MAQSILLLHAVEEREREHRIGVRGPVLYEKRYTSITDRNVNAIKMKPRTITLLSSPWWIEPKSPTHRKGSSFAPQADTVNTVL